MSMDDVERSLDLFLRELDDFNQRVRSATVQIESAHDRVAPLWQDEMSRDYHRRWTPLEEKLHDYRDRVGPHYVEEMSERLGYLRRYLNGD